MRKINNIFLVLLLLVTLVGCTGGSNPPDTTISVKASPASITLNEDQVLDYDYLSLFKIVEDDEEIEVIDDYVDTTHLEAKEGTYKVTCTYKDKKASVIVVVTTTKDVYELNLSVNEISINKDVYDTYDYLSLFEAKLNGSICEITPDMIQNNVKGETGTYTYIVKFGDIQKTLTVHVGETLKTEVVKAYQTFEIKKADALSFDYTKLFYLYVNGVMTKVTRDMVDTSKIRNLEVGKVYDVTFKATINNEKLNAIVQVKIVEETKTIVNARNVTVYPNGSYIDLTSLFTITKGDKEIPVTLDMITGSVNYNVVGENIITLTYENITKEAIVEVKRGVIINYATSDTISIIKGTNQSTYDFISDFEVVINGIKFTSISSEYLDTSKVDFNNVGSYKVMIKIPYNDQTLGLQGVKFTYYEKEITYVVTKNKYEINILSDIVELNKNVTKYNPFDNLKVVINNRNQTLTKNINYVDIITCYAEELSNPIDLTKTGNQNVKIALYVNGVDEEPVIVEFIVVVLLDINITSNDSIVISGGTIYLKDLFTIVENGETVEVSNDYISGLVDPFTPGIYEVKLTYKNIEKTSKVVVLDSKMIGTYKTRQTTIPVEVESEDDEDEIVYGPVTRLKDLVITKDGKITVNGTEATIEEIIDENNLIIKLSRNKHYLSYDNGIIVINPLNENKMQFNEYSRPIVYFHSEMYTVNKCYIINYGSAYVLSSTYTNYSIDLLKYTNKTTNEICWYALKVHLIEKNSADTVYDVTYGKASIPSDYNFDIAEDGKEEVVGVLTFNNEQYKFVMKDGTNGKISKDTVVKKYVNTTFNGKVDGFDARLTANQFEGFSLVVNSKLVFSVNSFEIEGMANGGIDYQNDVVFFYDCTNSVYSYKFKLNVKNKTFELLEKDHLYGKYVYDNIYIFLDGYGTGIVNFNTASYYQTCFTYDVKNSDVALTYVNIKHNFSYEDVSTFYIDTFNNVLTSKSFMNDTKNDVHFENQNITSGAIVRINSYVIGADSDTIAKPKMLDNITIITKDGILNDTEKAKCVNTSRIKFSTAGFYQFTITINVNGEDVVAYYAVQVLPAIYKDNPVVGEYINGVITNNSSLSIDQYGRASLVYSDLVFSGKITINTDSTFVINASSETKGNLTITGKLLDNGIIYVECGGALAFSNYYTTGTVSSTGNGKITLHKLNVSGKDVYLLFDGKSTTGKFVSLNVVSGNIYKVDATDLTMYVRITTYGDVKNGLSVADEYRGTYTQNEEIIIVDGFGNISTGTLSGTYTLNGNVMTVSFGLTAAVYRLNNENMTFEKINITLDNSLVSGKTYEASYSFVCSGYYYTAETKMTFSRSGKVTIISTSEEHDSGSEGCIEDSYLPVFASKTGVQGIYNVSGNQVTVTVNGYTFSFTIKDVLNPSELVTNKTTLDSSEQGYFGVGTVFSSK